MAVTEKITKDLMKLGLQESQAAIYALLVRQGNLRINEIAARVNLPRSSVYESIRQLAKLGLAEEITENSFKTIQAYPLGQLKHSFQEKIIELEDKTKELD